MITNSTQQLHFITILDVPYVYDDMPNYYDLEFLLPNGFWYDDGRKCAIHAYDL
jgi:hypothetical protein